jgi:hypothetical protein
MSRIIKPDFLTDEYNLVGPERMYITGPLESAVMATRIRDALHKLAGPNSEWWPTLDSSLFFLGGSVPSPRRDAVKQVKEEDKQRRIDTTFNGRREILFVGHGAVDAALAYRMGAAVSSDEVKRTYFYGDERQLGDLSPLAEEGKLSVIYDVTGVYRWETAEGKSLRVNQDMLTESMSA